LIAVFRIVAAQFGVGLLTVLAAFLTSGSLAAGSALLGCLICAFPNAILGLRIAAAGATGDAKRLLRATYVAVGLKLVLTAALFAAVFVLVRPLAAGWLFAGFIATQATMWAAPLLTGADGAGETGGTRVTR
jgi:ATP synthase protein I